VVVSLANSAGEMQKNFAEDKVSSRVASYWSNLNKSSTSVMEGILLLNLVMR